jgi:class 3 adenylate cyclase
MAEERVHTFLFADIAGFTALTEAHGDEEAADLAARFFADVRALLPEYGAAEVKTIGDAVMVCCERATAAVELGLRIVDEVGAQSRFPVVRIGIHTGPAVKRGDDWFGAAVNVAARVTSLAGGSEVLVTEQTRQAADGLADVEFRHHGLRRFKNVNEPVEVFRAVHDQERSEELPIDPVCRMAVDPGQAVGTMTYGGVQYHFCSFECINAFSEAPAEYANPA